MIIKLLAVVGITASIGADTTRFQDIKYAAPPSYDYSIRWIYNASSGATQLWGYTPNGGGIWQLVVFYSEANYWRSYIPNFYYAGEFTIELRIPNGGLNDAMFSSYSSTITNSYLYNSPDNATISSYVKGLTYQRLHVSVLDADYSISYKRNLNAPYSGVNFGLGVNALMFSTNTTTRVREQATDETYPYLATFSTSTNVAFDRTSNVDDTLVNTETSGLYFKLNAVANIEGDDWWDIYNQGVDAGYDAGFDAGYDAGVDAGRLENTAWDDAFTIIKGAIDTVGDVMTIQLFGPITIGTLVSIPLIVGLLFWIIDKWRGS